MSLVDWDILRFQGLSLDTEVIPEEPPTSTTLDNEIREVMGQTGNLVQVLLEKEKEAVQIFDFNDAFANPFTLDEVESLLQAKLIDRLSTLLQL